MFTRALVPLKESAAPYFPAVVQVALERVPVLPPPEASAVVVPDPSLKAYAATRPVCASAGDETGAAWAVIEAEAESAHTNAAAKPAATANRPRFWANSLFTLCVRTRT